MGNLLITIDLGLSTVKKKFTLNLEIVVQDPLILLTFALRESDVFCARGSKKLEIHDSPQPVCIP